MEKTINPTKLSSEDAHLLKILFEQSQAKTTIFKKDRLHTICLPSHKRNSSSFVDIKLTHTIVKRKRENQVNAFRYDVIDHGDLIGEGGFSHVFKIAGTFKPEENELHLHTNKKRAVKVINHQTTQIDVALKELINEIDATRAVGELHIKDPAYFYPNTRDEFYSYVVMRRKEGLLFDLISNERDPDSGVAPLTTPERLQLTLNTLRALRKVHAAGVIHRDIKLENMFFDRTTKEVTYIDYGLSKSKNDQQTGCVGTQGYIPPESYRREVMDEKSDIYSLGIALSIIWGGMPQSDTSSSEITKYEKPDFKDLFRYVKTGLYNDEQHAVEALIKSMASEDRNKRPSLEEAIQSAKKLCANYILQHRSRHGSFSHAKIGLFRKRHHGVNERLMNEKPSKNVRFSV